MLWYPRQTKGPLLSAFLPLLMLPKHMHDCTSKINMNKGAHLSIMLIKRLATGFIFFILNIITIYCAAQLGMRDDGLNEPPIY